MIVIDLTDHDQMEATKEYFENIDKGASNEELRNNILLVGNKSDLNEQREISFEDGMVNYIEWNKCFRFWPRSIMYNIWKPQPNVDLG